jgi:hypothetical protein
MNLRALALIVVVTGACRNDPVEGKDVETDSVLDTDPDGTPTPTETPTPSPTETPVDTDPDTDPPPTPTPTGPTGDTAAATADTTRPTADTAPPTSDTGPTVVTADTSPPTADTGPTVVTADTSPPTADTSPPTADTSPPTADTSPVVVTADTSPTLPTADTGVLVVTADTRGPTSDTGPGTADTGPGTLDTGPAIVTADTFPVLPTADTGPFPDTTPAIPTADTGPAPDTTAGIPTADTGPTIVTADTSPPVQTADTGVFVPDSSGPTGLVGNTAETGIVDTGFQMPGTAETGFQMPGTADTGSLETGGFLPNPTGDTGAFGAMPPMGLAWMPGDTAKETNEAHFVMALPVCDLAPPVHQPLAGLIAADLGGDGALWTAVAEGTGTRIHRPGQEPLLLPVSDVDELVAIPGGGVLVVGLHEGELAVARLTREASLDTDFGVGGWFSLRGVTPSGDVPILADRSGMLVLGQTDDGSQLFRFDRRGRPDTSWGTDGALSLNVEHATLTSGPSGAVVVGTDAMGAVVLTHVGLDGTSRGIGSAGRLRLGEDAHVADATVDDDGRVTVLATRAGAWVLARLLPDGSLDPAFGDEGRRGLGLASSWNGTVQALSDGGLLVFGGSDDTTALLRLAADGTETTCFGQDGRMPFPGDPVGLSWRHGEFVVTTSTGVWRTEL